MKRLIRLGLGVAVLVAVMRFLRGRSFFQGKVVLITGGSRGLGLALARRLGAQGAKLVLLARDAAELQRAAEDLWGRGIEVETIAADVRSTEAAEAAVRKTIDAFGRLDVLINNAGTIIVGPLGNMEREDYEKAMAVHFWAPLQFMNAARPHLEASQGRIVNIASIGGKIAVPHLAAYTASKFALAGLSESFRAEIASSGIRVTTVFPGLMRTGSHIRALFKGRQAAEFGWFALGSATSLTSVGVDRAARQILRACAVGVPELVIGFQARVAVWAAALFPNVTARVLALVNRALPAVGPEGPAAQGRLVRGAFPPRVVTILADRASAAYNELGVDGDGR